MVSQTHKKCDQASASSKKTPVEEPKENDLLDLSQTPDHLVTM